LPESIKTVQLVPLLLSHPVQLLKLLPLTGVAVTIIVGLSAPYSATPDGDNIPLDMAKEPFPVPDFATVRAVPKRTGQAKFWLVFTSSVAPPLTVQAIAPSNEV
jgi:hypothetical protein